MQSMYVRSLKIKFGKNKLKMRSFLSKLLRTQPRGLDKMAEVIEKEVWAEIDCLSCANCCKSMTPTFTKKDIDRISAHFDQTPSEFKEKWLEKDRKGDWMNVKRPCQFLDKKTHMCSIYEIRPSDCAGFPHLSKKRMIDYIHVHKQNIEYCPATYSMVEKMQLKFSEK